MEYINAINTEDLPDNIVKEHVWHLLSKFRDLAQQSIYLLIDPTLRPPSNDEPLSDWLASTQTTPVPIAHESFDQTNSPCIALFNAAKPDHISFFWKLIAEAQQENQPQPQLEGHGRRICALISTESSAQKLAEHIGRQALQRNALQDTIFLRYYDPAVWPDVWATLDPAQRALLCGPVSNWFSLNEYDHWIDYANPDPYPISLSKKLTLTHQQCAWLEEIEQVNYLVHTLKLETGSLPQNFRQHARESIAWARRNGFSRTTDVQACAFHLLRYREAFRLHPRVMDCFAAKKPEDTYFSMIDSLTEHDWSQIQALAH